MESNYSQHSKILSDYPELTVLSESEASVFIEKTIDKYRHPGINDMHYIWSYIRSTGNELPIERKKMTSYELRRFYEKNLPDKLPTDADVYLIIDCCDGRFIVYATHAKTCLDILIDNYFELVEVYFADTDNNLLFCVNHNWEVIQFS